MRVLHSSREIIHARVFVRNAHVVYDTRGHCDPHTSSNRCIDGLAPLEPLFDIIKGIIYDFPCQMDAVVERLFSESCRLCERDHHPGLQTETIASQDVMLMRIKELLTVFFQLMIEIGLFQDVGHVGVAAGKAGEEVGKSLIRIHNSQNDDAMEFVVQVFMDFSVRSDFYVSFSDYTHNSWEISYVFEFFRIFYRFSGFRPFDDLILVLVQCITNFRHC